MMFYFWLEENFVTDFVPSEMACFANSPGRIRRTAVWISRDEIVDFFEYDASSAGRNESEMLLGHTKQDTYWKPRSRYAQRCR